jgi:hypothetical protein
VCLVAAVVSVAAVSLAGIQPTLDRRAVEEAIFIGQSRFDAERDRFHAAYRVRVSRPPVDWIDVITPYHRVALAAEARARLGDYVFGQRQALAALAAAPNVLELLVELTFHPLNAFVGVPAYDVMLSSSGKTIKAHHINRYPRLGPRFEAHGPALPDSNAAPVLRSGQPLLGGTMVVQFAIDAIDPSLRHDVVVADSGKEIVRVGVDFGKMR